MRKIILFSILFISTMGFSQDEHVTTLGRWGKGTTQAVHRWNNYILIGNGNYLELYKRLGFNYTLRDRIALEGPIEAIYSSSDTSYGLHANVFVACGYGGLKCIYLDPDPYDEELIEIGELDLTGYVNDLHALRDGNDKFNQLYVTTSEGNVHIVNVTFPSNPTLTGTQHLPYPATCVTAKSTSILFAGVGDHGVYSIDISDPQAPDTLDHIRFPKFLQFQPHVSSIAYNDSVAFVATGVGGLKSIDIQDPSDLHILGSWTEPQTFVLDVFLDRNYAHVAGGEKGLFRYVDISDPENFSSELTTYNTGGFATQIEVESDTAYIADGYNGLVILNMQTLVVADSIATADYTYDAVFIDNSAYIASGKYGVTKLDIEDVTPQEESLLSALQHYDTNGEARGLYYRDPYIFVATGSHGLKIWEVDHSSTGGSYNASGDSTFDVIVPPGSNCYLAEGTSGIDVVNYSNISAPFRVRVENTPGKVLDLDYQDDELFVADSQAVYVYEMVGSALQLVDSLTSSNLPMQAMAVKAMGDSVLFANGRYGFAVWNRNTDQVELTATGGVCTDLTIRENTVYLTISGKGLAIYDISDTENTQLMGTWPTGGHATGLVVNDDFVGLADKEDGFYLYQNNIKPSMDRTALTGFNFGPVPPGYSRSAQLVVKNVGTAQLNVSDIRIVSNVTFFSVAPKSFYVPPQDSQLVTVEFIANSTSYRDISTTIEISSNDPDSAVVSRTLKGKVSRQLIEEPYSNDIFTLGLYGFDELGGNVLFDESDYEHDGYITPAVDRENEIPLTSGSSLYFSANANDKAIIPAASHLNMNQDEFTVEFWFNMSTKPVDKFILMQKNQYQFTLAADNQDWKGVVLETIDKQGEVYKLQTGSMANLFSDHWYHTAMTLKNDTLKLLLNGNVISSAIIHDRLLSIANDSLIMGTNSQGNYPFHGYLDEVRFSNVARQSWEFNVNRTGIALRDDIIDFAAVRMFKSRSFPVSISNSGKNDLNISNIDFSESIANMEFQFGGAFTLSAEEDTTIWITWAPETPDSLDGSISLVIESNDPTFPQKRIPVNGYSITTLKAGAYQSDYFTLGLWHCDEGSNFNLLDASSYDMDGRLNRGAIFDTEKRQFEEGSSIRFDGINDYSRLKALDVPHLGTQWGGFTAECWFRLENALPESRGDLIYGENASVSVFSLSVMGSKLKGRFFNTANDSFIVDSEYNLIDTKQWYHAALSLSQDSLFLYLNGELQEGKPFSGYLAGTQNGIPQDTFSVLLGNDPNNAAPFYGNIDEIRFSGVERQPWEFNVNLARIKLSESSLNFGNILYGESRSLELTVTNPGIATLIIDSLYLSQGNAFSMNEDEFFLDPNFSQNIEILFQPTAAGNYHDTLNIISNDPYWTDKVLQVPLEGVGLLSKIIGQYEPDPFTVALYHCNEGTGTVVSDTSQREIDATLHNEEGWTDITQYGHSALNLQQNWIYSAINPLAYANENQFSIEFWFWMQQEPSSKSVFYFSGDQDTTNFAEIFWHPDHKVTAIVRNASGKTFTVQQTVEDTVQMQWWNHIALIQSSDYLKLYLNKSCVDSVEWTGNFQGDGFMIMGADSANANFFNGKLDEIRISNIARQPWELNVAPPTMEVSPLSLTFTKILVGYAVERKVYIKNLGDQRLQVTGHFLNGSVFQTSDSLFQLPDNDGSNQKELIVKFIPDDAGAYNDTLVLTSNAVNLPEIKVPVSGKAVVHVLSGQPQIDSLTVSYYSFNEDEGATLTDGSGNGYTALLKNGVQWTAKGAFEGGLHLDGINDYIQIESPGQVSDDFTIECFFKTDTTSQTIFSKAFKDTTLLPFQIRINSSGNLTAKNLPGDPVGPFVSDNAWHHIALSYTENNDSLRCYVDGQKVWSIYWQLQNRWYDTWPIILGASPVSPELLPDFYFQGYIDEFQMSKSAREIWNYLWIKQDFDVRISSMTPQEPVMGQALNLRIHIPVKLNADSVYVNYRDGGGSSYQKLTGSPYNDTTYTVQIPSEMVSLQGLEYYFEVTNDTGYTFTVPLLDAENKPYTQVVHYENLEAPVEYHLQYFQEQSVRYQYVSLFSIPLELDDNSIYNILETAFGAYDPFQWRLYWWRPLSGEYIEYAPKLDVFELVPGRSFWLIRHNDKSFNLDKFHSVDTQDEYTLDLLPTSRNVQNLNPGDPDTITVIPGWNMIANPFIFPVSWNSCVVTSDSVSSLYAFNGKDGFEPNVSVLEPWKGYFVVNQDTQNASIIIPPRKTQILTKNQSDDKTVLQKGEWSIRFGIQSQYANDLYNFVGAKKSALGKWDIHDLPEPPYLGDHLSFYVQRSDWQSHKGKYTTDYQNLGEDGYTWNIEIVSSYSNIDCRVNWEFIGDIPELWEAYLLDLEDNVSYSLRDLNQFAFNTGSDPQIKKYRLIVGSKEYIENNRGDVSLIPKEFKLYSNYPNPFNHSTEIKYSLPEDTDVKLIIYNALGQEVLSLVDTRQTAGYYTVQWNGRNRYHSTVSSGVYLIRLQSDMKSMTKKMLLLK